MDKPKIATFAGSCFWCLEAAFETLEGVKRAESGYTGGTKENPTYAEVSSGKTGHYESNRIKYDSSKVSYKDLLDFFWRNIDPLDEHGQFVDKGSQYKTAIFYHSDEQKRIAGESKKEIQKEFDKPVVTEILPAQKSYPAEEHHQQYYKKKVLQYKMYKMGSGRNKRLKELWG